MKHPELFKNGPEFVASMKELITHYKEAIRQEISKNDYTGKKYLPCLLCNPLSLPGRDKPMSHSEAYNNFTSDGESFFSDTYPHRKACEMMGCPWIVIEGMTCDDWSRANSEDHTMIYFSIDKKFQKKRIAQLKHWITKYNKFMKENKSNEKI